MKQKSSLFTSVNNLTTVPSKTKNDVSPSKTKVDLHQIEQLVGEVRPDDGMDPREEFKRKRRELGESRPGFTHGVHKEEQFLSQVQTAIESALQCAYEPILNQLSVREIVKQGGTLAVVIIPQITQEPIDLQAARAAMEKATPMLSREVAASITRKETPKFSFVVLPAEAEKIEE